MASSVPAIARPPPAPAPSRPDGPRASALPVAQRRQHARLQSAPPTASAIAGIARAQSLSMRPTQARPAPSERRSRPRSPAVEPPSDLPAPLPRSSSSGVLGGLRSLIHTGSRSRRHSAASAQADTDRGKAGGAASDAPVGIWKRVRTISQSSAVSGKPRQTVFSSVSLPTSERGHALQPPPKPQPQASAPNPVAAAGAPPSRLPPPHSVGAASLLVSKLAPPAVKHPAASQKDTSQPAPALDRPNMIRFPVSVCATPHAWLSPADRAPLQHAVPASSTPPPVAPGAPPGLGLDPALPRGRDQLPGLPSPEQADVQRDRDVPSGASSTEPAQSSDASGSGQPMDDDLSATTCEGYAISPTVAEDQVVHGSMRQRSLVSLPSSTPRMSVRSLPAPPRTRPAGLARSAASDSASANQSPKSRSSLEPVAEGKRADARPSLVIPRPSEQGTQLVSPTPPPPYSLRTASAASSRLREQRLNPKTPVDPTSTGAPLVRVHPPMSVRSRSRDGSGLTVTSARTAEPGPAPFSQLGSREPNPPPLELGSSEIGTVRDRASVSGLDNMVPIGEEELSVAQIEANVSVVEAILAEHNIEGSFDANLLHPLSAPMHEVSSGSFTLASASALGLFPPMEERRRTLHPSSSRALTQAARAVRQALGPDTPPHSGSRVHRDVEDAYVRMLALVAQATDDATPSATPLARSPAPGDQGKSGDKPSGSGTDRTDSMTGAPVLPHAVSKERLFPSSGRHQGRADVVAARASISAFPDGDEDDHPRRRFTSDPHRRALPEHLPNIDPAKLTERHLLETESLLDALERAEAAAGDARRESVALRTDLRLEVARVLQLERAVSQAQSRAEDAETKLTRAQDQLRLEREARVGLMQQLEQLTAICPRSGSESANLTAVPATKPVPDAGRCCDELPATFSTDTAARFLSPVEDERESRSPSPLIETQMPDVPTIDDADLPAPPLSPPSAGRSTRRKTPVVESRIPRGHGHLRSTSGPASLRKLSDSTGDSSFTARTSSSVGGGYVYDRLGRGYYDPHRPTGYSALEMPNLHREIFDSSVDEAF